MGWVQSGWPSDGSKFGFMGHVGLVPIGQKLGQVGFGWLGHQGKK